MFTKKGRPSGKGGACGSTKSALHKLAVQGMLKFFHPRRPSHSREKAAVPIAMVFCHPEILVSGLPLIDS